jgi:Plant transposon protein
MSRVMLFSAGVIEAIINGGWIDDVGAIARVALLDSISLEFLPSSLAAFPQTRSELIAPLFEVQDSTAVDDLVHGGVGEGHSESSSFRKRGPSKKMREGPPLKRNRKNSEPKEDSNWWRKYLAPTKVDQIKETERNEPVPPASTRAAEFRSMFRVPFAVFEKLKELTIAKGWYDPTASNAAGEPCKDLGLLILGVLHCLGHAATFLVQKTNTNISAEVHRKFFLLWCDKMASIKGDYIYMPRNTAELDLVTGQYETYGFPGCCGSIDVVKIGWDKCPASMFNLFKGKEGYPSIGYQVICNARRCIQSVGEGNAGTHNDKTTIKFDSTVKALKSGSSWLRQQLWFTLQPDGSVKKFKGAYLICDGGYLRWPCLICPVNDALDKDLAKMGGVLTAARKDIECTFGSLKQRFKWLKTWNNLSQKEDIDHVFVTCCILHNILLEQDGYLDPSLAEKPGGVMENIRDNFGLSSGCPTTAKEDSSSIWLEAAREGQNGVVDESVTKGDAEEWKHRIKSLAVHQKILRKQSKETCM